MYKNNAYKISQLHFFSPGICGSNNSLFLCFIGVRFFNKGIEPVPRAATREGGGNPGAQSWKEQYPSEWYLLFPQLYKRNFFYNWCCYKYPRILPFSSVPRAILQDKTPNVLNFHNVQITIYLFIFKQTVLFQWYV